MVGSYIDKTGIAPEVVNAIGLGARNFGAREVVTLNFVGLLCRKPLLTGIVVVADEFLLFCVHRNHRNALRQAFFYRGIDVPKLRIAVGVVCALLGLPIALQTIVQIVKNLSDLRMADRVFCLPSCLAIARVLLQIHRSGDCGSPRVWQSIISSNASNRRGSETMMGLRPAPGRRMRPADGTIPS